MKLVALFGPQQAGKSEAAKAIATLPGWHRLSFAQPLYDMMSALLGTDARKLDKTVVYDALCGKTLREGLQLLGTEFGRNMIGDTIWLRAMERALHHHKIFEAAGVVIDDLRFANEYEFLRQRGATIIRIERAGCIIPTLNQGHASEADWMDFQHDHKIINDKSILSLADVACDIAQTP